MKSMKSTNRKCRWFLFLVLMIFDHKALLMTYVNDERGVNLSDNVDDMYNAMNVLDKIQINNNNKISEIMEHQSGSFKPSQNKSISKQCISHSDFHLELSAPRSMKSSCHGADVTLYILLQALFTENFMFLSSLSILNILTTNTNAINSFKVTPGDPTPGSWFGISVSISNNRAAVGNKDECAYIYEFNGSSWPQTAKLTPSDANASPKWFGYTVSIDNNDIIIAAHNDESAYIFKYNDVSWIETKKLTAFDGETGDIYGHDVSISNNIAVVSAKNHNSNQGAAYIYEHDGSSWQFKQKLTPPGPCTYYGHAVDVDNDVIVIGSWTATYVYHYNGTSWIFVRSFPSSISVALDAVNNEIVVGSRSEEEAYVFDYNGSMWIETALLLPNDPSPTNEGFAIFDGSVSISGNLAIVGAPQHDHHTGLVNAGAAYLYEKNGSSWTQRERLIVFNETGDKFGRSVSINGNKAIVGATQDNDVGSAYIYTMLVDTKEPTTDPTTDPSRYPTNPTEDPTVEPTIDPTVEPTANPTNDPTTDPTNDPSIDPTIDPTVDPTLVPTEDPTLDPTTDPTVDPTTDPTLDPTIDPTSNPTIDPTVDPTSDPTIDPTSDPTFDPTEDPTYDPTSDPTTDPTVDPTVDPTLDPTSDPTTDPTHDPTSDPTFDPTFDPTTDPTVDPTTDPTTAPSSSPTTAPLELHKLILQNVSEASSTNNAYMYSILFGVPSIIIFVVFIMKSTVLKDKLLSIDKVQYLSVVLYFIQLFDLYSDAMFSVQLYYYYSFTKFTHYEVTSNDQNTFYFLFLFSMIFTILPYCANFVSSVRIVASITMDPIISKYSKEWFKYNSTVYSIGVLLSGGSYYTLKVINSNFLGLPQLSAGLSVKQIEAFAPYKIFLTTIFENLPQMIIQFYFVTVLKLVTTIAVISMVLSLFNILLSILTTLVRRTSFGNQNEYPFVVHLSILKTDDGNDANPYRNAGRIEKLSQTLKALSSKENDFDFEIMSFSAIEKSLFGVVMYKDALINDIKKGLDNTIEAAVSTAFECDEYAINAKCYYPLDSIGTGGDHDDRVRTDVVEVEMKVVHSDSDGYEGALPDQTDGILKQDKADTLSVEELLLQNWNLGQYWNQFQELGFDDHKYWKILIKNQDSLQKVFGTKEGHQQKFIHYVEQMK